MFTVKIGLPARSRSADGRPDMEPLDIDLVGEAETELVVTVTGGLLEYVESGAGALDDVDMLVTERPTEEDVVGVTAWDEG